MQDSNLQTTHPFCLRRSKPKPHGVPSTYPDRDWTNPNRFSDPLNRASYFSSSVGLTLPGRPNKAYTWYLDNGLPWGRGTMARSRASWNDRAQSLFGNAGCTASAACTCAEDNVKRRWYSGGAQPATWERVRTARAACRPLHTLDTVSAALEGERASPHVLSQRRGLTPFGQGPGNHTGSACVSHPAGSARSSPCGSQRSSPSPQGTLSRLSPSMLHRHSPGAARLSPTHQPAGSPASLGRAPCGTAHPASARAAFVSQWVNNSFSPSNFQLSPFSARSSQTSNGREDGDVSFGSETDDEFFYVSCQQLTKGLADLSVTSSKPVWRHEQGGHVVENPSFTFPADVDEAAEDEDDFDGCSDDALSDDVFLDNPEPVTLTTVGSETRPMTSETPPSELWVSGQEGGEGKDGDGTVISKVNEGGDGGSRVSKDGAEYLAVESLRRNSLQSKLRKTWRHRRHRVAGHRAAEGHRATEAGASTEGTSSSPADQTVSQESSPSQSATGVNNPQPPTPQVDEDNIAGPSEGKPCYYYVISPTDDVNMPDVIAVRRNSVELIRWQNSLRRRRRRQAKRHDLGRSKKKEPTQLSATA